MESEKTPSPSSEKPQASTAKKSLKVQRRVRGRAARPVSVRPAAAKAGGKATTAKTPLKKPPVIKKAKTVSDASSDASNVPPTQELLELRKRVKQLELLKEVAVQFGMTLDFNKLMANIFERVIDVLEAEAGSFWIPDPRNQEIVCKLAAGPSKDKIIGFRLKEGVGVVGSVIQDKRESVIFDAASDSRHSSKVDEKTKFVTKSMLSVPLIVNKECVGAIQVINKMTGSGQFDKDDLEIMRNIAASGAVALKNARLFQSEQRIRELNALLEISKELTSTLDLDRVLLSLVNLGSNVIKYKRALVALVDAENIVLASESGQVQPDLGTSENRQLKKIMAYVFASKRSLYLNNYDPKKKQDAPEVVCQYMNEFGLRSLSVIILADSEGALGILSMEGEGGNMVTPQSQYVIKMLMNQATIGIRNAQLYQNIPSSSVIGGFKGGSSIGKKYGLKMTMGVVLFALAFVASFFLPIPAGIIANVEIVPAHKTQVSAIGAGVVKEVLFQEGNLVEQGQVLVRLDPVLLELEETRLENDHAIALSKIRQLEYQGMPDELYMARLEVQKLENQKLVLQQKMDAIEIRATESGRVLTPNPEELLGRQIAQGEMITEIAVSDQKSVNVLIQEQDILKVQPGDEVSFTLQAFPGAVIDATLNTVSQEKTVDDAGLEFYIASSTSEALKQMNAVKFGMTGSSKISRGMTTVYELYLKPTLSRLLTRAKLLLSV